MKKILLLGLFMSVIALQSVLSQDNAHSKKQIREYRKNPLWVAMMDDSTVNYYEAKFAFEEFWRGKPTPEQLNEGEFEAEEEEHERNIFARILKSDKKYKAEIVQYAFEHRKFNYWLRKNAPYVKEDGTVMSQEEKDLIVQQEIANRNAASNSK